MDGEELRRRRMAMNMSQAELGRRFGVPYQTIWKWENGKVKMERGPMIDLALRWLEQETMQAINVDWKEELRKDLLRMNEPITLVDCGYSWDTGVTPFDCRMVDGRYAHLRVIKNRAGVGVGDTQDAAVGNWPDRFAFDTDKSELTLDEFAARLPPWIEIKR